MRENGFNNAEDRPEYGMAHIICADGKKLETCWEYIPKEDACDKCQAMKGLLFAEKPGPVHPNCKCEIRQVTIPHVNIMGLLQGYEDHATEKFTAGKKITVEIRNLGPFIAGARVRVYGIGWDATGHMFPGQAKMLEFSKHEEPTQWEVFLISLAGDNSTLQYFIRG